jgi:hypothetical protein
LRHPPRFCTASRPLRTIGGCGGGPGRSAAEPGTPGTAALLFLYSAQFGLDFHLASVRELCRVAREVRIFPLLDLAGNPSAYLGPVLSMLERDGIAAEVVRVPYEFQRGGNEMLRIGPR